MTKLFAVVVALSVVGCSNKAVYDDLRRQQREHCQRQGHASRAECIEHSNQDYEEYERARQEVLE